jgi:hypothetical protein
MENLKFIDVQEEHLEMIREWRNSPEVSKYMYSDNFISAEDQKRWFERIKRDKNSKYWVINFENQDIGLVYLNNINKHLNSCEWGFYLGPADVKGKGIGQKLMSYICKYVFEELKLNKLMAQVFKFNERSLYLHEKLGFRREAYYREHCFKNEKYEDVIGLAILKKEYEQLKFAYSNSDQ